MKLLGLNITPIRSARNAAPARRKMKDLMNQVKHQQLHRTREDVKKWRDALAYAERAINPDRVDLIRVFQDITLDPHLSSLMDSVKKQVKGSPFFVVDKATGEVDEAQTERFRAKWVRDLIGYICEAPMYGYSLVQFGDIVDGEYSSVELLPREHVVPEDRVFKKSQRSRGQGDVYIDDEPYNDWVMLIGESRDMGLLNKAAPMAIHKKSVMGAWAQASEVFGMPLRLGKTDINDPTLYANMTKMLAEMARAAYAVMDREDEIEYTQTASTDYYQIYDSLIERSNSEMSKLFLGQTMTSDSGSSRSQAEVHERKEDAYITDYKTLVSDVFNDQLFPMMERMGMLPAGLVLKHDNEEKIAIDKRFEMVVKLIASGKFAIDPQYIQDTFGIPVEAVLDEVVVPDGKPDDLKDVKSVMPSVAALYRMAKIHAH